jgi:SSS family solute:Na+ symporter
MLAGIDIAIFVVYCVGLVTLALWVSRERPGHEKNTEDYFLAGRSLPWWAVGTSLIASNISAEQIIGMCGSGYVIGLGIAAYEWMAAVTLLIVGRYFVPIFLKKGVATMPQFLEMRYDHRVRVVLAFFWLAVYIFVNLTSVLYLGGLAIQTVAGVDSFHGIVFLAALSLAYSIYGGLKAVALTDVIQVTLLVLGGLAVTFLALDQIGEGQGVVAGFAALLERAPEKFDMILAQDHPSYAELPGVTVLVGGMWIANLSYWGFNQYITQRALAAKSIDEAQKGIAFAAFLKLLMPVIVVLPGIAAFVLVPDLDKPDRSYPTMMGLLPPGLLGLTFSALVAAIVSSLGSMTNSISTIFTLDIYRSTFHHEGASEHRLVVIGRVASAVSLIVAALIARPLLGSLDQAFQYIQEFTGFFTPGILLIFLFGFFWKRANSESALVAAISSVVLSAAFKIFWPTLPFLDRMGLVFLLSAVLAYGVTVAAGAKEHPDAVDLADYDFATSGGFNAAAVAVCLVVGALYVTWW